MELVNKLVSVSIKDNKIPNKIIAFVTDKTWKEKTYHVNVPIRKNSPIILTKENICMTENSVDVSLDYELPDHYDLVLQIYQEGKLQKSTRTRNVKGRDKLTKKINFKNNSKLRKGNCFREQRFVERKN